jgi:S1-C subfamily serine protease
MLYLPSTALRTLRTVSFAPRFAPLFLACLFDVTADAATLPETIKAVKPAVVAIGSFEKTRSPAVVFSGTGFAVGDGLTIITNAHVINTPLDTAHQETLGVLIGQGDNPEFRVAAVTAVDEEHDLARLKIGGAPLPVLALSNTEQADEGQEVAFTGFPLGSALGYQRATHRGIIAALTPIVRPALGANGLNPQIVAQLRRTPFFVYQLDATAYPGNSGSPMYDPETGQVLGVINMVYVKGMKENAISHPSGISYAIPVQFVREILQRK